VVCVLAGILGGALAQRGSGRSEPEAPPRASATGLRPALAGFARQIQRALRKEGARSLALGDFSGPATQDTNAGPGLQRVLLQELEALGLRVEKKAEMSVKGEYTAVRFGAGKSQVKLRVRAVLRDGDDNKVTEMEADVRNEQDIIQALGLTGAMAASRGPAQRNKQLTRLMTKPAVHIDGARVRARKDSLCSIEVRARQGVKDAAQARKARAENGQAFVKLAKNELYEIHVRNHARHDIAIKVTIDGVDVFSFSDERNEAGQPKYQTFIVQAGKEMIVPGWFRTLERSDAFSITSFAKSAAAKLMVDPAKVGAITVCVFRADPVKPKPQPKEYKDEYKHDAEADEDMTPKSPRVATGFGPRIATKMHVLPRKVGELLEAVTVRYSK
jgi:hypothetical protein